jgi:hypothetical protein
MNILIINVHIPWVYRLYEEYIISIYNVLKKYYIVNIDTIFYDILNFTENSISIDNINKYDKILYGGNIDIFNSIFIKLINDIEKIYFINIEQLSNNLYYSSIRNINNNIKIIDYSEENIPFLKGNFKNVFLFSPYFENKEFKIHSKKIDVLSLINNNYRKSILDNIKINKKYNILYLNECYNNVRNEYYLNSKIYINIHGSDNHKTMELIRIVNLIMNKVIIVSQNSINNELLYFKDYIIICNDNDKFSDYINEILSNYEYYYNKIYSNFNVEKYNNYIKENFDKFIHNHK